MKKIIKNLPRFLAAFGTFGFLFFLAPQAFAAQGDLASQIIMYDSNANGKIDQFLVSIDNPGSQTALVNATNGWSVTDGGSAVSIASVVIDGLATANPQRFFINLDESDPDLTVDTLNANLEISYTQVGAGVGTDTTSGVTEIAAIATGDAGFTVELDLAAPVPVSATFYDVDTNGKLDLLTVAWSEDISATDTATGWTVSGNNFASIATAGIDCGTFIASLSNTCDVSISTSTIKTNVGNLQLAYVSDGTITDGTTAAASKTFTSASTPAFTDGAAPVYVASTTLDNNNDGTVDYVRVQYSEPILDSTVAASDFAIGIANTTAGNLTESFTSGLPSSGTLTDVANDEYIYVGVTSGTETISANKTDYALKVQQIGAIDDASSNTLATFSSQNSTDAASPVYVASTTLDNNNDGTVDYVRVQYSEPILDSTVVAGDFAIGVANTSGGNLAESFTSLTPSSGTLTDVANDQYIFVGVTSGTETISANKTDYVLKVQQTGAIDDASSNTLATFTSQTSTDAASPVYVASSTLDADANGTVDYVRVEYSEAIDDSTAVAGDFIAGINTTTGNELTESVSSLVPAVNVANDKYIYVGVVTGAGESISANKTDYALKIQQTGAVNDTSSNILATFSSQTSTDAALPVYVTSTTLDNNNDGTVDYVRVQYSEPILDSTVVAGDFAIGVANTSGGNLAESFTSLTPSSGTLTDVANDQYIFVGVTSGTETISANKTDYVLKVQQISGLNDANSNTLSSFASQASTDAAKPIIYDVQIEDSGTADGLIDKLVFTWTENIDTDNGNAPVWGYLPATLLPDGQTAVFNAATITDPAGASAVITVTGITGQLTKNTAVGATEISGDLSALWVDGAGNIPHTTAATGNETITDAAKPFPISATFYDPDTDGLLDLITVVWSETISAVADGTADWAISSTANFLPIAETTVTCGGSGVEAVNECDYNFLTSVVKTNVGDLSLAYTAGTSVTDGTNTANSITFTSASTPAFTDGAAPVFVSAAANSNTNVNIVMSEAISAGTLAFGATADWNATGLTSSAVAESAGTINMTVSALTNTAFVASDFAFDTANGGIMQDASLNAVLPFTGKVITDAQAPTVSAAELTANQSACTGAGGTVCKIGDVITFTWDNSAATGDGNTDINTVSADLTNFGGSATQTLYDTGTFGDAQIGDGIYSYAYTVAAGNDDGLTNTFTVTATDTSANSAGPITSTDTAPVDNIAPIINTAGSLAISLDNGTIATAEIGDQVTYTAATVTVGDTDTFSIDLSALTGDSAATVAGSPYTVVTGVMNTSYAFTETATDNAGNTATGQVAAILVDNASGNGFNTVSVGIGDLNISTTTYANVSFNSSLDLPANGKIAIVFPPGFNLAGVITVSNESNIESGLTPVVSGQTVTLTRSAIAAISAGTLVSFRLNSFVNPSSAGITGNFGVSTKTSGDVNLSSVSALSGVVLVAPAAPVTVPPTTPNVVVGGGGGGGGGGSYFVNLSNSTNSSGNSPTKNSNSNKAPQHAAAPTDVTAFTDIIGHWAKTYIEKIAKLGIVQGKTPTQYAPDDNISRAELLKIAVNSFDHVALEQVVQKPLPDVNINDWYAPYVKSAFDSGIIYGFDSGLGPNLGASRGMAVTVLAKAAGFSDVQQNFFDHYTSNKGWGYAHFPDVLVDDYYAPFVAYLYDKGIIDGYEDGTFGPGKPITRAEIAKIVVNILEIYIPVVEGEPDKAI